MRPFFRYSSLLLLLTTSAFVACSKSDSSGSSNNDDDSSGGTGSGSGGGDGADGGNGSGASPSMGGNAAGGSNPGGSGPGSTGGTGTGGAGGAAVSTGGQSQVEVMDLDLNFYQDSCVGDPDYTMGAEFDVGACYSGAEIKQDISDSTPGLAPQARSFLDQVFPDAARFVFACAAPAPSFTRYSDPACMTAVGMTSADSCAFVTEAGPVDVYGQQICSIIE